MSTWDTIPDSAKDADGYWYGDYYGVLAFEVNTAVVKNVPKDWADLLKPEYKGQVALAGDPTVSNQAISGVWASGFSDGGSLDSAQQGLDFFKKLNDAGNFVPVIAKTATVASGETPIRIAWTYNGLADKDSLAGQSDDRSRRADHGPVRWHVCPGDQRLSPRIRTPPSSGWSTCTPTRARTSG